MSLKLENSKNPMPSRDRLSVGGSEIQNLSQENFSPLRKASGSLLEQAPTKPFSSIFESLNAPLTNAHSTKPPIQALIGILESIQNPTNPLSRGAIQESLTQVKNAAREIGEALRKG